MSNMVLRSSLIILLAVAGIFLKAYTPSPADPLKKEFFTLQAVIKFLDRVHYDPKDMGGHRRAWKYLYLAAITVFLNMEHDRK